MELVNEWFPNEKIIKVDTPFWKQLPHEKEIMNEPPSTVNPLRRLEI